MGDLNRLLSVYNSWHNSFAPKLEFSYFAERLQKLGTSETVKSHMTKLRKVYKGEEELDLTELDAILGKVPAEAQSKEDFNSNTVPKSKEALPMFDYEEAQNLPAANKPMTTDEQYFEMLDNEPEQIDTTTKAKPQEYQLTEE